MLFPCSARSDKNELGTRWWQRSHFTNSSSSPSRTFYHRFHPVPHTSHLPIELNIPFLPARSLAFVFPLYLTRFHIFAQSCFYGSHIIYDLCFFGVYWQRIKIFRDFITYCSRLLPSTFRPHHLHS